MKKQDRNQTSQLLPAPERSVQSALIGSAFFLEKAAQSMAEVQLGQDAFPDPLFHALYQLVCRLWQADPASTLSEVVHRDAIVQTIVWVLGLTDEHGPMAAEAHALNLWRQTLHHGGHVHDREFPALLNRFVAYESQRAALDAAKRAVAEVAMVEEGSLPLGKLSSTLRATSDRLAAVSTRTTLGTSPERWADLTAAMASPENYISTGFAQWDRLITTVGGFPLGSLHAVSAPTGHGKTAVMMGLLRNICFHGKCPACYVNYEVAGREFAELCCAAWTGDNPRCSERDELTTSKTRFLHGVQALARRDLFDAVHQEAFNLSDLSAVISNRASRGYRFFIVDTCNRLLLDERSRGERFAELERCVQALEQLAVRLDVVIVLAAQENREKSKRVDKAPMLSDIGGSSAIEQCAHSVAQLYRADLHDGRECAELHVTKSRGLGVRAKGTNIVQLRYEPGFLCYVPNVPAPCLPDSREDATANEAAQAVRGGGLTAGPPPTIRAHTAGYQAVPRGRSLPPVARRLLPLGSPVRWSAD